ncbi:glycerol-3-phosphate acyltransferase [Pseudomonadota bacterium]
MSYADIANFNIYDLLIVLLAYMVGGFSTGYLLVRFIRGVDVRSTGSGGLGARNVGRVLGRRGFYLTLFADVLKGAVIVWLARWFEYPPIIVGAVVVAVVAGHIWPIWLQFRGGKGIATCLGAFAVFNYKVLLVGGSVFVVAYIISRQFLLSWVLAFLSLPLLMFFLEYPTYIVVSLFVSTAMVIYAHKENIKQALL